MGESPVPTGVEPEIRAPVFRRMHPVTFVIVSLGIVFVLYQIVAGLVTVLLLGRTITQESAVLMRIGTAAGQILCILVPTLLLTRARYGAIIQPLRLRLPSPLDTIVVCIAVFALQQVLQGYMIAQDAIPLPPRIQHYVQVFKDLMEQTYLILVTAGSPREFIGVVLTVALVPAIVEELLFRGLVQRDLEAVSGGLGSALIAGVIFGLYHLNPFSCVPLIVLGMFFGFVVHRSQNITLAMTAHFLNNFVASCALYMNLGDDFLVFAPSGAPSTRAIFFNTLASLVVFIAATYYFVRMHPPEETD
jgi:membrane protease YdiL (CAAX protease family)